MTAAAVQGLAQILQPPIVASGLIATASTALILTSFYAANGRSGDASSSRLVVRLAPVSLAFGVAMVVALCWELLNDVIQQPAALLLSRTVMLVITALALTMWGHAARRRAALCCGLGCMGLALAKVMLIDLVTLKSLSMLASLVVVAMASVAVSVILRRRA
jgi:hypothetical protein